MFTLLNKYFVEVVFDSVSVISLLYFTPTVNYICFVYISFIYGKVTTLQSKRKQNKTKFYKPIICQKSNRLKSSHILTSLILLIWNKVVLTFLCLHSLVTMWLQRGCKGSEESYCTKVSVRRRVNKKVPQSTLSVHWCLQSLFFYTKPFKALATSY